MRARVLRAAREMPTATATQIAARVGCHQRTAAKHLRRVSERVDPFDLPRQALRSWNGSGCPRRLLSRYASDPDWRVRVGVTLQAAYAPSALMRLTYDTDVAVRENAAKHPHCPPEALLRLASEDSTGVRMAVAGHPRCPPQAFRRLAHDTFWPTRQFLAGNAALPQDVRALLREDPDHRVQAAASRIGHSGRR